MLSDERIREIKERCEKATKGPFRVVALSELVTPGAPSFGLGLYAIQRRYTDKSGFSETCRAHMLYGDANLYAYSHADIPDLLAEIERLRGELAARPVLQSRNKSDAIRIAASESLIPKEKD